MCIHIQKWTHTHTTTKEIIHQQAHKHAHHTHKRSYILYIQTHKFTHIQSRTEHARKLTHTHAHIDLHIHPHAQRHTHLCAHTCRLTKTNGKVEILDRKQDMEVDK